MVQRNSQRVSSRPQPDPAKRKPAEGRDPEDAYATMPSAGTSARNLRVVTLANSSIAEKPPKRHRQAETFGISPLRLVPLRVTPAAVEMTHVYKLLARRQLYSANLPNQRRSRARGAAEARSGIHPRLSRRRNELRATAQRTQVSASPQRRIASVRSSVSFRSS